MKYLPVAVIIGLTFVGCQMANTPRARFELLSLLGVEVPGLDLPIAAIPGQRTVDGRPQVLVYGPSDCQPTRQTVTALAQVGLPHLYKNSDDESIVSQDELGALILAIPPGAEGGSPFVLVNGRVLLNPTLDEIRQEYARAAASL